MKISDVQREIDRMSDSRKMSKRFKELAEQAGIKFYPLMIDGEEYDYEDVVMDGSDDLKKFAELIVQECADWIRTNYDHEDAEGLAFKLGVSYGVHGDYA